MKRLLIKVLAKCTSKCLANTAPSNQKGKK
jgi:hypothetical protein